MSGFAKQLLQLRQGKWTKMGIKIYSVFILTSEKLH